MEYLQLAITGLSVIAAILAWIAKIRWSKEYSNAKDATIAAKDAQIQVLEKQIEDLRDLTPMKLREYVLSIRIQLEEYNENLQSQVNKLKTEIAEKNDQITKLEEEGTQRRNEIVQVRREKLELSRKTARLETTIRELKPVQKQVEATSQSMEDYDQVKAILDHIRLLELKATQEVNKALPLTLPYVPSKKRPKRRALEDVPTSDDKE